MSEKRIQQVLEIEKQALEIREAAVKEADQLPGQAERDAQALLEKSRTDAEEEARQIIAKAKASEEGSQILAEAEGKAREIEETAKGNFDKAVTFVVTRVLGKE